MESFLNALLRATLHSKIVTVVATLLTLLCSFSLRTRAQGCPALETADFTTTLIAANSDCDTPARLTVSYRNAVVGFTAMTYRVSKDGAHWGTPVVMPRPEAEATLPLDNWHDGDKIYIRAEGTCGTQHPTLVLPPLVYQAKSAADVQVSTHITPAGGCTASGGAVALTLTGVSGFRSVSYRLEQAPTTAGGQPVPVGDLTARSPYRETLFFNLSPGHYTLHVRATPSCQPTTPGAKWKDGAYEWEQPIDVEHFAVIPTPIPTRGTCPGGVTINAAKVVGVSKLRYQIWKKGAAAGTPPLQTANVTHPFLSHTFTGLPLGDYEVRANSTECQATASALFSVPLGAPVQPQVTVIRNTYANCATGRVEVFLPGTTVACPVTFQLTPAAGGTPQVLQNVTTDRAIFSHLAAGTYMLAATYGGETVTAPVEIKTLSLGTLKTRTTSAEDYCSMTGTMDVEIQDGVLEEAATLELSIEGNPVRSVTFKAGETQKHITELIPGAYTLTLKTVCGATLTTTAVVGSTKSFILRQYTDQFQIDFCQSPLKVKMNFGLNTEGRWYNEYNSEEEYKELLIKQFTGASYIIKDNGKVVATGPIPVDKMVEGERGPGGSYRINPYFDVWLPLTKHPLSYSIQMPCGTPTIVARDAIYPLRDKELDPEHPLEMKLGLTSCNTYKLQFSQPRDYYAAHNVITVKLVDNKTGSSLGERSDEESDILFENVPAGDYYYEVWGDCANAPHHRSAVFSVPKVQLNPKITPSSPCQETGEIYVDQYNWHMNHSLDRFVYTVKLFSLDGREIPEHGRHGSGAYGRSYGTEFKKLAPGTYKLKFLSGECEVSEQEVVVPVSNANAQEILHETATLGAVGSNANTLSFDFQAHPGSYTITLRPERGTAVTKTVVIADDGNAQGTTHVTFENLPDSVTMLFPTGDCGTEIQRGYNLVPLATGQRQREEFKDALHLTPVFEVPGCRKGRIKLHADLELRGVPQRPTAVVIKAQGYYTRNETYVLDSISSPNIITDWEKEIGDYPMPLSVYYYYDGKCIAETLQYEIVATNEFSVSMGVLPSLLGEQGRLEIWPYSMAPTDRFLIRITNSRTHKIVHEETLTGADKHIFDVFPGDYTVSFEGLDGCYAGQVDTRDINIPTAILRIETKKGVMNCANDGVITVSTPQSGIDHIDYEITSDEGGEPIRGQSATPNVPKEFPGLAPGNYKIKATAIVLRGADGAPHHYEATASEYLSTSYSSPLQVRPAPEKALPTINGCEGGGSIGLVVEGSRAEKARVFITESPEGPLNPRQEITRNENGTWGQGLAPGAYKLWVTDGCMDIVVPKVNVESVNFDPKVTNYGCVWIERERELNSKRLTFTTSVTLPDINSTWRSGIAHNIEVQIVASGAAPDEQKWETNSLQEGDRFLFTSHVDRFPLNNGFDILYRYTNCPQSLKRAHQAPNSFKLCAPFEVYFQQNDTLGCRYSSFGFSEYDSAAPYHVVVRNDNTGEVLYDKVKIFKDDPYKSREFSYLNGIPYTMTITSVNDPMSKIEEHGFLPMPIEDVRLSAILSQSSKQKISCTSALFAVKETTENCFVPVIKVFDKTTGAEIPAIGDGSSREYWLQRGHTYTLKAYHEGQLKYSGDYTPNYTLPNNYFYEDIDLTNQCVEPLRKTTSYYKINKIFVEWPTDENQEESKRTYDDSLKVIVRDNVGRRTFEAHGLGKSSMKRAATGKESPTVSVEGWNEITATGDTIKNVSPDLPVGAHELEVHTSCGDVIKSTFNVIYKPSAVSDVKFTNVKYECDGAISFTPAITAAFPDRPDPVEVKSYSVKGDPYHQEYRPGDPIQIYAPSGTIEYTLRFSDGSTCTRTADYDFTITPLAFDRASTVSLFCTGADKGQINVALKGGHMPYTYELRTLSGTLLGKKTAHGGVTFEEGALGQRYRLEATDSCGLTHLHQEVLLQDPAMVSGSINGNISVCEGSPVRIQAFNFPGATYTWTLPDGSKSHEKELNFTGTPDKAGTYNVEIKLNSCSATIYGKYDLRVVTLSETTAPLTVRTCAGQSAIFAPEKPIATSNGKRLDGNEIEFQWEFTKTPADPKSWKRISGATDLSIEYVAAYPGTYYLRRTSFVDECVAVGGVCTLIVDPGITITMSATERKVVIDHKDPFLLTAGIISGPAERTYLWQRSLDGKKWVDIGTDVSYTETQRYAPVVYYRRIVHSGTCETKGEPITVLFKRRYPALINPQLRQRVDQNW